MNIKRNFSNELPRENANISFTNSVMDKFKINVNPY